MGVVEDFLANHDESLPKELGMEFVETSKSLVVMRMSLDHRHVTEVNSVQGGIVMTVADIAGAFGAVLNLEDGYRTTTLESKTNFLRRGSGNTLWAESVPIHVGRTTSVWRTLIWRGDDENDRVRIAEVTQTQLNLSPSKDVQNLKGSEIASEKDAEKRPPESDGGALQLADLRRQEILAGAIRVMIKKGFAKASVREIANAAGMPVPTMYKYVSSKEDILELIYENFINGFHDQLRETLREPVESKEKFIYALEATIRNFDKHHNEVKLLFTESKSLSRDALRRIYAQDRRYVDEWQELVIGAGADVRLGIDAESLANLIYYLTTVWPMRHWAIGKWGLEEIVRALVAFVGAAAVGAATASIGAATETRKTVRKGR